ncbi:MAG: histidine phosphatase family protein [Anaerolineae bacterium]|nr:histidine phosphatase family protein [Anaerolineae bacterium]
MTVLILVKHSAVTIDTARAASAWRLSDEGRRRCDALAERLAAYQPQRVVASQEPKAAETGRLVAERLALPFTTAPDLHEHDRRGVPFLGADEFQAAVARFFAESDGLVLGRETAAAALARFDAAVRRVLAQFPGEALVVVAHGTVISLFVARHAGVEAFDLWRRLDLPSVVVLDWPTATVLEVVASVV